MENNKKGKYIVSLLCCIVFCLFLAGGGVISIVTPKENFSVEEKRALQEIPDISRKACLSGEFQKDYENYLSDHFILRPFWVKMKTKTEMLLGKDELNGVYIGKDNYLIEKYGSDDFDDEWVTGNIWCLSDFLNMMINEYGEDHVRCLFVPSKANAIPNKLPYFTKPYNTSFISEKLQKDLKENLEFPVHVDKVIRDLTPVMQQHQDEYIYYRTDHHWTTRGAYYAYEAYKNSLGKKAKPLSSYRFNEVTQSFYGTTFDKVQVAGKPDQIMSLQMSEKKRILWYDDGEKKWTTDTFYDKKSLTGRDTYNYFLGGNVARIRISTGTKNKKNLLLLKDSYSNSFVPYLDEDFENIFMIDLRYVRKDIFTILDQINKKHEITDVLVMYNTEKFMQDNHMEQLAG